MTICLNAYVTLWVEASYSKVPPFYVGGYCSRASEDMKYLKFVSAIFYQIVSHQMIALQKL